MTSISADGVTVTCDEQAPNPFTSGIGSVDTNTNLTVDIDSDAEVSTLGTSVRLASGGSLSNAGTLTADNATVVVTDSLGVSAPTIDNEGVIISTGGTALNIASSFNNTAITNSGTLSGATAGVVMAGGQLDNSGTIVVTETGGTAIRSAAATIGNTGTVLGTAVGVDAAGSINNSGLIEAETNPVILSGGSLINSGTIRHTADAGTAVTADNSNLTSSGTVTSDTTAFSLTGGSLENSGSVTGAVNLTAGAALVNTGTMDSRITADGNASITNSGTVLAAGDAIQFSGGGNTLTLQSGSSIAGAVRAAFVDSPDDSLLLEGQGALAANVENFGSLVMRGSSWALSGAVSARRLEIESGRLDINGTLDTRVGVSSLGLVNLQRGSLGGVGTLVANLDNVSGTVAPGFPTGTLTVGGDYSQGSAGTLSIASDAGGGVGLLRVTGTASLAGTVVVQAGSDGIYDFLTADGGIEGSFDQLVVNGRALVTLVPGANTISFVRASTTVEDSVVFAALDAAVLTLDALQTGGRSNGQSGIWLKPMGYYGEKDEDQGIVGSDFSILGGMAGADWSFGNLRVGGGVGYTKTDLDIDDGGEGEADNTIYGAYAEYVTKDFHASLTLSGGSNEFEHDRSIFINDQRARASADYDGDTLALRLALGGKLPMRGGWGERWVFEPELRADYLVLDLDPYIEDRGTGLQRVPEDDIEAAEFSALFHIRRDTMAGLGMAPRFHLGVVHRVAIDDREWSATDLASGVSLLLPGDDEDITSFRFGAGLDFELGRRWLGAVDYLGESGDEAQGHSLVASIKLRF